MMLDKSNNKDDVIAEYNITSITNMCLTPNGFRFEAKGNTAYDSNDNCKKIQIIERAQAHAHILVTLNKLEGIKFHEE